VYIITDKSTFVNTKIKKVLVTFYLFFLKKYPKGTNM